MVDRDLILRKLAALDQYVSQVSAYRHITGEQYRRDWKTQRIIERTLQLAIEVCVDIANHLIADRGLRVPTTYAEAFEVLGEAGLLEATLRDAMIRMGHFRDGSVHQEVEIDPAIAVRIVHEHLGDFALFRTNVLKWI